jgi:hypothetical protein
MRILNEPFIREEIVKFEYLLTVFPIVILTDGNAVGCVNEARQDAFHFRLF